MQKYPNHDLRKTRTAASLSGQDSTDVYNND